MGESNGKTVERLMKWFVIPTSVLVLIFLFIYPSFQRAGFLYLAMAALTFALYNFVIGKRKKNVYGVQKGVVKGTFLGVIVAAAFIVMSMISPAFSMGIPEVPVSAGDEVRAGIVVGVAPTLEESFFRGAMLSVLMGFYGWSFAFSNVVQAFLFSGTHLLAYGIYLEQLTNLVDVFGAVSAILGLFLAAFVFGLLAGLVVKKTKNIFVTIVAHATINASILFLVAGLIQGG